MSGGSEVWINASDWRRAAAVVREQNIRRRERRGEEREMERVQALGFWKEGDVSAPERRAARAESECQKTPARMSNDQVRRPRSGPPESNAGRLVLQLRGEGKEDVVRSEPIPRPPWKAGSRSGAHRRKAEHP